MGAQGIHSLEVHTHFEFCNCSLIFKLSICWASKYIMCCFTKNVTSSPCETLSIPPPIQSLISCSEMNSTVLAVETRLSHRVVVES